MSQRHEGRTQTQHSEEKGLGSVIHSQSPTDRNKTKRKKNRNVTGWAYTELNQGEEGRDTQAEEWLNRQREEEQKAKQSKEQTKQNSTRQKHDGTQRSAT